MTELPLIALLYSSKLFKLSNILAPRIRIFLWMGHFNNALQVYHLSTKYFSILYSHYVILKIAHEECQLTSMFVTDEPGEKELNDLPEISMCAAFSRGRTQKFERRIYYPSHKEHAFSGTSVSLCSRLLGQTLKQQISCLHWYCAYQWTWTLLSWASIIICVWAAKASLSA